MMGIEHGGYIIAAYAATVIAVGGLLVGIVADYRHQVARLKALEERGLSRRSAEGGS